MPARTVAAILLFETFTSERFMVIIILYRFIVRIIYRRALFGYARYLKNNVREFSRFSLFAAFYRRSFAAIQIIEHLLYRRRILGELLDAQVISLVICKTQVVLGRLERLLYLL